MLSLSLCTSLFSFCLPPSQIQPIHAPDLVTLLICHPSSSGQYDGTMTSHLHGGNHRPPHRTTTAAISRPISHSSHTPPQTLNPTPRSVPQHVPLEYNLGSSRSQDGFEPASKRQKLDISYTITSSPIELQQSSKISSNLPLQPGLTAVVNVPSVQADHSELFSANSPVHVPCFPARPKDRPSWTVKTTPLNWKPTPKESVQAKPYQLEVPKSAPYYEDNCMAPHH